MRNDAPCCASSGFLLVRLSIGFGSVLVQWLMTRDVHVIDSHTGQFVTFAQEPIRKRGLLVLPGRLLF
jgi:hypothetical protein